MEKSNDYVRELSAKASVLETGYAIRTPFKVARMKAKQELCIAMVEPSRVITDKQAKDTAELFADSPKILDSLRVLFMAYDTRSHVTSSTYDTIKEQLTKYGRI